MQIKNERYKVFLINISIQFSGLISSVIYYLNSIFANQKNQKNPSKKLTGFPFLLDKIIYGKQSTISLRLLLVKYGPGNTPICFTPDS